MIPSDKWLEQNSLFAQGSAPDRTGLARRAIRRQYQKGEFIAHYQEVWPYLLLVEEGAIDLLRESEEGHSLIVATLEPGEVFWGLAFFYDDAPSVVSFQARDATCLWLWPRDTILPFLLENGKASWELCRLLVRRMERASAILGELAFQPVAGRVARLLLDHFRAADDERVKRDLTLDEMAARAGTTRAKRAKSVLLQICSERQRDSRPNIPTVPRRYRRRAPTACARPAQR